MSSTATQNHTPPPSLAQERALRLVPELLAFLTEHSRLPKSGSGREDKLYGAVRRLRGMVGTTLDDRIVDELDHAYPTWRGKKHDDAWQESFDRCRAFVADNGRFPTLKDDARLNRWLDMQVRFGRDAVPHRRRSALDAGLPGWDQRGDAGTSLTDSEFESLVDDYATWAETTDGRDPRTNGSAVERRLLAWRSQVRGGARSGKLPAGRREYLLHRLPGFLD